MEIFKKYTTVAGRLLIGSTILFLGLQFTIVNPPVTESVTEIEKPIEIAAMIDPKQLACMAKNIYYEARGEPIEGKAAVARVVLNRVQYGFAKTPCAVIYQTTPVEKTNDEGIVYLSKLCQFSWVCDNKGEPNKNSATYKESAEVAYQVLAYNKYKEIVPSSTLFFHNIHVDPSWPYKQVAKIGNHIFYSKSKKVKKPQQQDTI
jgi:spore germination cell wall hydrolase CwlJ-like protein